MEPSDFEKLLEKLSQRDNKALTVGELHGLLEHMITFDRGNHKIKMVFTIDGMDLERPVNDFELSDGRGVVRLVSSPFVAREEIES